MGIVIIGTAQPFTYILRITGIIAVTMTGITIIVTSGLTGIIDGATGMTEDRGVIRATIPSRSPAVISANFI